VAIASETSETDKTDPFWPKQVLLEARNRIESRNAADRPALAQIHRTHEPATG